MRDLIRRIIREQILPRELTGCNYFDKNSYDYKWCKFAENSLSKNRIVAYNAIKDYKNDFLKNYQTGLRAQLYDKEHKFFSDRRKSVLDAMEKFKSSCPKFYSYIIDKMTGFTQEYVILNAEGEYDLLNKLNTNWSALSVLLTLALPENYKDLRTFSVSSAQKKFFKERDEDGFTLFERFMNDWEKEQMYEKRDKIYRTIIQTSKDGQDIEDEFFNFIKKYVPSKQFSGDYSFMDMIGVDMIIQEPGGNWIPVQVKKYGGACSEISERKNNYRNFMCENWCVSYEKKTWKIRTYIGDNLKKSKEQCKTKPLNMTCFFNIDTHETNHETCEPEIKNLDREIDF